jgi:hypothetical protein
MTKLFQISEYSVNQKKETKDGGSLNYRYEVGGSFFVNAICTNMIFVQIYEITQ